MGDETALYGGENGDVLLYIGDRKKPKNCPEMRAARDMFEDPENQGRKTRVNRVSRMAAEKEWQSTDRPL